MKPITISRRRVLGGLLAAPVVSVTGCGGSGRSDLASGSSLAGAEMVPGDAVPAAPPYPTAGQLKQMLVYYVYSGDALEATEQNLHTLPDNVATTNDRFAQGALCYQFDGAGASVTVDDIEGSPTQDFALLLWLNSSKQSRMQLLQVTGTGGASLLVEIEDTNLLSISWNGIVVATVPAANAVQTLADGAWHHLTVQRYRSSLQVFVDGTIRGAYQTTLPLPADPTVLIGGGWEGAIDDVRLYNRAFPALSIPRCVYSWTQVKPDTTDTTGNLAAYFPFNGNALNYLGYGVEAVADNVTLTSDRYGSSDAAYLFNGSNSAVVLNTGFESTAADFALGFWEQSGVTGQMTALSASSGGIAGTSLDIVFNGGAALQIYLGGVALPALSVGTSGTLTDGNWHFVVLQRAETALQLYIDGKLAATTDNSSIFFGSTSVMQIGAGSGASAAVANRWNGTLDDVQIYEGSLTAQQIVALLGLEYLGRDGAGPLSFQGKMWLLGGWNQTYVPDTNSEVWSSVDGVNWTLVTIAPWERRHDAGYAVLNNKMWIVGGDKETGHYQNNVWCSADGVTWQQVTDNVPWANRATQYVVAFNDRLWLMGGQQLFETAVPPVVAYNDVWSSADGVNWQLETPAAPWSPRGLIMGSVVFQGRMWVIGGGQYDVRTFNNDVWSSADGVNWTQVLTQAPWSPRQFHNIAVFDNKIWVLAGGDAQTQGGTNDVWYSTDGAWWTQLPATPWMPRHAASTFTYNNYLWLTCGSDARSYNDVWKLGYAP